MSTPEISIVVCTYQRPGNLSRVLASIAGQQGVDGKLEVVVADDGSRDETAEVFARFQRSVSFPTQFVTHPHRGFCPSRCRNQGVAASTAKYLLLLDGDCLIPPDHALTHLQLRRRGLVLIGDRICLSRTASNTVDEEVARTGQYQSLVTWAERARVTKRAIKTAWHNWTKHPLKPCLTSNNVGMWREDYVKVNGFDENYVGWGCEDDDFGLRLRRTGLQLASSVWYTWSYHLWHPTDPTAPTRWKQGGNVEYFKRPFHLKRCGNGLVKRPPEDVRVRIVGTPDRAELVQRVIPDWCRPLPHGSSTPAEVEILFAPYHQPFSGQADCNVLVLGEGDVAPPASLVQAHLVLAPDRLDEVRPEFQFGLSEFADALQLLLVNSRPAATVLRRAA